MKHLYVISGAMGVGKTAVCQQLKPLLAPCAFFGRGLVLGHGTLYGQQRKSNHGDGPHPIPASGIPSKQLL